MRLVRSRAGIALALILAAQGCAVGPNYSRPATVVPPVYKEAGNWVPATPSDAADKQDWWTLFGDQELSQLEAQVAVSNQTLAAAEAAYREAHAIVAEQRAQYFPAVSLNGSADVTGGGSTASTAVLGGGTGSGASGTITSYRLQLGATWEPDLWGRVRRSVEDAKASAQASAADLANARLSAQSELAADYIQLRELDELGRLYAATAEAYRKSLTITQNKHRAGVVALSDVRQAETQLYNARATFTDVARQRAIDEHAIAILIGKPPAELTIGSAPWTLKPVAVPAGLPSTLLERRPDVAAAERRAAASSANIGVQVAAYFPSLSLTAGGGTAANVVGELFSAPSLLWSLGAGLVQTLFDGGARRAQVSAARAGYDEAVANYRQTVLTAFGQVEDNLASQRVLAAEQGDRQAAFFAAEEAAKIFANEYQAGTIDYTNVVVAQASVLSAHEAEVSLEAARLTTTVDLLVALGGGWRTTDLPPG